MPILLLLILLLSPPAFAFQYETPLEESAWSAESSVFKCSLKHDILGYGVGQFVHEAGRPQHLELNGQIYEFAHSKVQVVSDPPDWRPRRRTRVLSEFDHSSGELVVSGELVSDILSELNKGMLVGFKGALRQNQNHAFDVYLSSVGFSSIYSDFKRCEEHLLPASYAQLERSRVKYAVGKYEILVGGRTLLDKIVAYCALDDSVKTVYVDGHTDDEGSIKDNVLLSERRASNVTNYLVNHGMRPDMIVTRYHGKKYPAVNNKTTANRAKNRRTTIRLSKQDRKPVEKKSISQLVATESKGI